MLPLHSLAEEFVSIHVVAEMQADSFGSLLPGTQRILAAVEG